MKVFFQKFISGLRHIWTLSKSLKHFNLSLVRKVFSLMSQKEKTILLLLTAVAITTLLWTVKNLYHAITLPAPGFGGSFTEGFLGQPTYLNPVLAFSENDLSINRLIYSGLYKYDNQGNLTPDLAEGMPQISEDQKQYTIKIKNNIFWHSGRKLTANDIIFTLLSIKDAETKSFLKPTWSTTQVEKLDDFTVKFTTKEVSGPFLHNLTLPILPKYNWSKIPASAFASSELNLKAIGTGPYKILEIKKLASGKIQSLTLQAYTKYHGGRAKINHWIIKFYDQPTDLVNALHSGDIQGFGYMPFSEDVKLEGNQDEISVLSLPVPQFQALFFNFKNPNLVDRKIRLALKALISQTDIINSAWLKQAKPVNSLFNFYLNQPNPTSPLEPNSDLAKKYLESAGFKQDPTTQEWVKNNKPLEFKMFTNDFSPNSQTAEMLAQNFKNFGIKITLTILPTKQLNENHIKPRNFDLLVYGQKLGADPDPFAFWHSSQKNYPGLNLSGFEDTEADKLLTAGHATTNQNLRQEKYAQLDELFNEKISTVYLAQAQYLYVTNNNLKGLILNKLFEPSQKYFDIPNWYLSETRVLK